MKNKNGAIVSSLCWDCKKSGGGCQWSRELKPVEGWKAEPDYRNDRLGKTKFWSYHVIACPEFEKGITKDYKVTDESLGKMITEIGMVLAKDYAGQLKKFLDNPESDEALKKLKIERHAILKGILSDTGIETDKFLKELTKMTVKELAKDILIKMSTREFNELVKERERKKK